MISRDIVLPYFGPGVPHEQKIWVDDLKITTDDAQGEGNPTTQGRR